MSLALKHLRSYWSILEVGEHHNDHHKGVADLRLRYNVK
jgi:hypothetical protein